MSAALPSEVLEGVYERDIFRNDDSGWTVGVLEAAGRRRPVTLVGRFHAQPGETLEVTGSWIRDPKYGEQFSVTECQARLPSTVEGLRRYLGSGLIKGIGPTYADRLMDRFGLEVPRIIEHQPHRLREVPGIGRERQKRIVAGWNAQKEIKNLMIFLQGHGVAATLALKVYKAYGDGAVDKIRENPYRLASDLAGVGFKTADQLARKIGIPPDAPERLDSALYFVLKENAESEGHTAMLRERLVAVTAEMLEVEAGRLDSRVDKILGLDGDLVLRSTADGELAFLRKYYESERRVAEKLLQIKEASTEKERPVQWDKFFEWFKEKHGIEFSPEQRQAIQAGYDERVVVITGGPGTGKSTLVKAVTVLCEAIGLEVLLAAPTGRAAKRLNEVTGKEAKTIHRLLEFDPKLRRFKRGSDLPLEGDVLIIDEVSMVDVLLFERLLLAVREGTRLILVGDRDQLPPVGAGNVLHDLIEAAVVPVVKLGRIYRQGEGSRITEVAHALKEGDLTPLWEKAENSDCFLFEKESPEEIAALTVDLVCQRIPKRFGLDPRRDLQVLVPMNRGVVGTQNLNQLLQRRLNSHSEFIEIGSRQFAVGDRVIQTRNNYDLEIFNGDIGFIRSVDVEEKEVRVAFDEREVLLDSVDLDDLELAYAISIHKSQGSEFAAIVIPIHTQHAILLQRNLLYTGITRGKRLTVVVGSRRALQLAVHRTEGIARTTFLHQHLKEGMAEASGTRSLPGPTTDRDPLPTAP